jgi:hypothetical protein
LLAQSVMPALPVSVAEVSSGRPECLIGLGVLTSEVSPDLVDEVIELAGCREKRRRLLPARTVVYFVLGLCLFSGADSMGLTWQPAEVVDLLAQLRGRACHEEGIVSS